MTTPERVWSVVVGKFTATVTLDEDGNGATFTIADSTAAGEEFCVHGEVRSDGCMNWRTPCVHFCSLDDVEDFAEALGLVYEVAAE